jgi:hypothetical protein
MEKFMEMEETLMEGNENNMGKIGFLKVDDNTISLLISYFLFSPLQVCFEGGNLSYSNLRYASRNDEMVEECKACHTSVKCSQENCKVQKC